MFLYFIESDAHLFDDNLIDTAGLRYAFDRPPTVSQLRDGGSPSGKAGFILGDSDGPPVQYRPEHHARWHRRRGGSVVYILPPDGPRRHVLPSLARQRLLPGADVTLCDGSRIHIPHARRWHAVDESLAWSVALPQTLRRDDDGRWIPGHVQARYVDLWTMLCGYIDAAEAAVRDADVAPGESVYFEYAQINELAIAAITANYRAAADEIELLRLFDVSVRNEIIAVLKDDAAWAAWTKKKAAALIAAGGNSSSGPAPSTPAATADTAPR